LLQKGVFQKLGEATPGRKVGRMVTFASTTRLPGITVQRVFGETAAGIVLACYFYDLTLQCCTDVLGVLVDLSTPEK
jgi:hypothetical protein